MKKLICALLSIMLVLSFSGCKGSTDEELDAYKQALTQFCSEAERIDSNINLIDPDSITCIDDLFAQLDELEALFKTLSEIKVPREFSANESLAKEAYEYMVEANEYFHQSFSETAYNEYTCDAGIECYTRANKRVQYILDIIHGEIPSDENVTATTSEAE